MLGAHLFDREAARLKALEEYGILDTQEEQVFVDQQRTLARIGMFEFSTVEDRLKISEGLCNLFGIFASQFKITTLQFCDQQL